MAIAALIQKWTVHLKVERSEGRHATKVQRDRTRNGDNRSAKCILTKYKTFQVIFFCVFTNLLPNNETKNYNNTNKDILNTSELSRKHKILNGLK